jgi:hypothetical protein
VSQRVKLQQVVREMFRDLADDLRVCLPGAIQTYDPDTGLATVQPLIMRKFYGADKAVLLPIIANVPVVHPRTKTAIIRMPVSPGDIVTMVFADRSIEQWISGSGDAKDPQDTRRHHLSDAYAILGGYPKAMTWPSAFPSAMEIEVKPGTRISVGNGTDELLNLAHDAFVDLKSICDELSATLTQMALLTVTGVLSGGAVSGIPVNAAAFTALKTTVDTLSVDVQTKADALGNLTT